LSSTDAASQAVETVDVEEALKQALNIE